MTKHNYQEKLEESEEATLRGILQHVYREFFPFLDHIEYRDDEEFQRSGRDLAIHFRKPGRANQGVTVCEYVEEKIRSRACAGYRDLLIEYLSSAEHKTLGWGFTSTANWLCYAQNGLPDFLHVRLIPMQPLRKWFMSWYEKYEDVEARTCVGGRYYTTLNKAIPFDDPIFKIFCAANGIKIREFDAAGLQKLELGKMLPAPQKALVVGETS